VKFDEQISIKYQVIRENSLIINEQITASDYLSPYCRKKFGLIICEHKTSNEICSFIKKDINFENFQIHENSEYNSIHDEPYLNNHEYISYYDVFDTGTGGSDGGGIGETLKLTKPLVVYDRIYLDPKTISLKITRKF
jgi:hypothetical protein